MDSISSETGFELDPQLLQTADFLQARLFLDALIGKTIASAKMSGGRTTITTEDGVTLVFLGFAGVTSPSSTS